jgi:parallel beta-helix repeat protein
LLIWLLTGLVLQACGPSSSTALEPMSVRVGPDGSGDYRSLEAAVEAVSEGSTINLDAGVYRLAEPLEIRKPLRLVGAGMDETEIVSDAGEYVVLFSSAGTLTAEGTTFRHQGEAPADVMVVVQEGQVDLTRCRFTGAVQVEDVAVHAGLRFQGDVTGTVRNCEAVTNKGVGVLVEGQADLILEENVCTGNESAGIGYYGSGGGEARRNDCSENSIGILVVGEAQPTLEENTCRNNEHYGIAYLRRGGGVARRNECSENGLSGILVDEQAEPVLEENVCSSNEESGIAYTGSAGGVARRNECSNNQGGIGVGGQARPTLEENVCVDNEVAGIAYAGTSGGVARGNECSRNDVGIFVSQTASPDLVENNCRDNVEEDIIDRRP